ncbi:hypothetical protein [Kaistia nematophila]|uniref:Uncharacterized protein n=1 Tax=Kaistia nematophila TaxID=2994654 RepID=A0A9X3IP22_9HYPH|nr:hypothetical protein [Kaistia nematophila]MCX5571505.1 hypothetical protein [Kaistia nematophila]
MVILKKGAGIDLTSILSGLISEFKDLLSLKVTAGAVNALTLIGLFLLIGAFFVPVILFQIADAVSGADNWIRNAALGIFSTVVFCIVGVLSVKYARDD